MTFQACIGGIDQTLDFPSLTDAWDIKLAWTWNIDRIA